MRATVTAATVILTIGSRATDLVGRFDRVVSRRLDAPKPLPRLRAPLATSITTSRRPLTRLAS